MSSTLHLEPGASVESGGKRYKITHLLDLEAVLCEEVSTGKKERLFIKDLEPVSAKANAEGESSEPGVPDLSELSEKEWQEAYRRFDIIRPLLDPSRHSTEGVAEQARAAGVHSSTIYRWIDAFERTGQTSALLPAKKPGGKGRSRLSQETEAVLHATIEDFYLNKQRRSAEKTCQEVRRRCRNAGLKPPHPNTIRNRIAQVSEEMKLERREGRKKAREKFKPIQGHFPGADFPLAVVQIDHTPLDIILVDDMNRRPIGRPWITLAIDVFSRMVTGFYLSLDPPGALSTGLCIAHSILPKEKWLARHDITTSWPCWGVMKKIHVDNAKEFRGHMLRRACEEYGIELEFRPVATPHYGGHIERMIGTISKQLHSLPGTTFSNPRERGEYKSEANAAMTLAELEKWLTTLIFDVYHKSEHSALGTSPIRKYEEGFSGLALPPRIMDEDRLRLDFMPYKLCTVQAYGIVMDKVHYYHDVLRRFINAADPEDPCRKWKFICKRDPRDISVIYFYDPELKQYFSIPYRNTSHSPISVWELREVQDKLKKQGRENIDEALIFDAYERMRQLEEKAVRETKTLRRAKQRRVNNSQIVKPALSQTGSADEADQQPEDLSDITPFEVIEYFD